MGIRNRLPRNGCEQHLFHRSARQLLLVPTAEQTRAPLRPTRSPRPHDLARVIHNADARFLDRDVESSKIGHAALLLLMLVAAYEDLVSSSALSAVPNLFCYSYYDMLD